MNSTQQQHQTKKNGGAADGEGSDSEPEEVCEEYFADYFKRDPPPGQEEEEEEDINTAGSANLVSADDIATDKAGDDNEPRCVSCGVALGYSNPRQYCCKTYCPNMRYEVDVDGWW